MIHFNYVRWKNFLSTGNNFTEIQLDKNSTTLIIGENGAGKSTILDAICFGLFGKPFRNINKGQLLNSVNASNCLVEVEFKVGGKDIKVIRGIKPNTFEIYINGKMYNQDANVRDYQKYLEQQILKLNYRSFTQVVILGSSTFVPFMQLRARHRREVVEELLDDFNRRRVGVQFVKLIELDAAISGGVHLCEEFFEIALINGNSERVEHRADFVDFEFSRVVLVRLEPQADDSHQIHIGTALSDAVTGLEGFHNSAEAQLPFRNADQ